MMDALTTNKSVLSWIEDKVNLVKPDKIVWIDGSKEQIEALRAEACSTGEMIKLNEEKLPDCYLHRTAVNDVAVWKPHADLLEERRRRRPNQQLNGSGKSL